MNCVKNNQKYLWHPIDINYYLKTCRHKFYKYTNTMQIVKMLYHTILFLTVKTTLFVISQLRVNLIICRNIKLIQYNNISKVIKKK